MKFPLADLAYITEQFDELATQVLEAWLESDTDDEPLTPSGVMQAMEQLVRVLHSLTEDPVETDPTSDHTPAELDALGEHGLHLLCELAALAEKIDMNEQAEGLRDLCFPMGLWIARQGGQFATLEPVVEAVAVLANRLNAPEDLVRLYLMMDELLENIDPPSTAKHDQQQRQPWRILVLNRAIVATRSLNTSLIENSYQSVAELLPDEAPDFFEQALEQMDSVGYPQHVREVITQFFQIHCGARTLH